MKKSSILLLILFASFSALSARGSRGNAEDNKGDTARITIGLTYLDVQGFYAGVRQGILDASKAMKEYSFSFIESNSGGDISQELQFVNNALTARVDALIMSAVSTDGSLKALKNARDASVPVITYNTSVDDLDYVYAYALGDPRKFGALSGERLLQLAEQENMRTLAIGVINCETYEVCVQRREGFEAVLQENNATYEIVANQEGTELDRGIDVAIQMINANPRINIMYGESGGATLSAVRAIRKLGRVGSIFVVGSDMTTEIANELEKNDVLKGITDISGKEMGALAFELAVKAIRKEPIDAKIVPAQIRVYSSSADAKAWLETHKDGLP